MNNLLLQHSNYPSVLIATDMIKLVWIICMHANAELKFPALYSFGQKHVCQNLRGSCPCSLPRPYWQCLPHTHKDITTKWLSYSGMKMLLYYAIAKRSKWSTKCRFTDGTWNPWQTCYIRVRRLLHVFHSWADIRDKRNEINNRLCSWDHRVSSLRETAVYQSATSTLRVVYRMMKLWF